MEMEMNLTALLPAAEVTLTALVVLVIDLFLVGEEKSWLTWISLTGLGFAAWLSYLLWDLHAAAFDNTLLLDNFGLFFTFLFLISTAWVLFSSTAYLEQTRIRPGEFHALILFGTAAMIIMAQANDLVLFFLGLETLSVALYVLTGMWRERSQASEAAMKYFLMGAFAAGFFLYGIALIYGATGSTQLDRVSAALGDPGADQFLILAGGTLLLVGLAFKIAAVPFHFWAPDVYEGAPTPVTGFMAVAVKAAAFAGWGRIFLHHLQPVLSEWEFPLWALAVLTMTGGNFLAITQTSVKRMLAYSSIAHAGYLLIGLVAGDEAGASALLFYLLAYLPMTLGAFGLVAALKEGESDHDSYRDFAGLGFRRPFLGLATSVFMLSLAGFPPLAGFTGKFYLFRAAVNSGHTDLAVIGALNSLLSVIYYLRVIVAMYMEEGGVRGRSFSEIPYLYVALGIAVLATLSLGILPASMLELSRTAYQSLLGG